MTNEMRNLLNDYSIMEDAYYDFDNIFRELTNMTNATVADYEAKVMNRISRLQDYHLAQYVAVQFYKEGKYMALIRKLYDGFENMKSEFKMIDDGYKDNM